MYNAHCTGVLSLIYFLVLLRPRLKNRTRRNTTTASGGPLWHSWVSPSTWLAKYSNSHWQPETLTVAQVFSSLDLTGVLFWIPEFFWRWPKFWMKLATFLCCKIYSTVWLRNFVYISTCYANQSTLHNYGMLAVWMYRNNSHQMFCVSCNVTMSSKQHSEF